MIELAQAVLEVTGSKSKLTNEPLPKDDPKQRCPDITKAKRVLGWEPKVNLRTGLSKTADFYRKTQFGN
jgi:nucleoside-diphosphate-sugar epimerase